MDYTEKVLEYFRNPKNMGRIENADGIGKVGNPVCLYPDEKIILEDGIIPISQIEEGIYVFTHKGNCEKVLKLYKRFYKGKILILKNKIGEIKLTPDHILFGIKIPEGDKYKRTKWKKELMPGWYHASQLKKGDIIAYPILKEKVENEYIEVSNKRKKYDFKSKDIPQKILLDEDFLRLSGYYLSEGYIKEGLSGAEVIFTFNIKEKEYLKDISSIVKSLFGLEVKIKRNEVSNVITGSIYNVHLARLFKNLFGLRCYEKKLPELFLKLPKDKQKQLILGIFRGDGYYNLKRDCPRFGYSTTSYFLTHQLKSILLRLGISISIYKEKSKVKDNVNHRESYRIHIGQRDSLKKMCEIFKIDYNPVSYPSVDDWFDEDYFFTPLRKIEEINYSGPVYNIEVENVHSFVSEGFTLHNCGDVMWIYIKVGKNEKGEEIIEDIKFETFGCAAAIATSSVVTELAKGKTLKEAEKISNKDVVEFLGGLPPIKKHCSLLAEEGLKAAIDDYYKKNERKRESG